MHQKTCHWLLTVTGSLSSTRNDLDWMYHLNTLRPRRNEQHFADDICKRIFFNENVWILIKISLKFVPKGPITLSQWSSSGSPVAIQCACNSDSSVHLNATGEMPVCFQWCSSGVPVAFQWSSSVFQLCKLTLDRHWDTTGCKHQPVWFQWQPNVLVAPLVFQCVPIMQINTGSPLEDHWALASASVVPVAF